MSATDRKDWIDMSRTKATVALLVATTALGACTSGGTYGGHNGVEPNRSIYSVNQPVVERTEYVIDLASSGSGLAAGERERLDAWFGSLGLGYGDRLWVEEGYSGQARQDVARVAADYGLLLSDGAPVTAGAVASDAVRVIVSRSTAHVPNCPNWGEVGPSSTSPGYGCAVNSNLAAMIADPADLVLGQAGSGTGDATTASKAIRVYRDAAPSGSKGLSDASQKGSN